MKSSLWSRGMAGTLCAQFLSAFGDNALLFAALGLVHGQGYPTWSGPLLQEFFIATYIMFAPFVGVFADATAKGRVMLMANAIKFAGGLGMYLHVNPFVSYALVGLGAAANSPAKYGILGELTSQSQLVKANGVLEASTIAAILLGAIAGGALTDWSIEGALLVITLAYAGSALSALLIPRRRPATRARLVFKGSLTAFARQARALLKDQPARLALIGTGLFWGAGASLRFLVIAWVPAALKITNNRTPGFLTAMVAFGIVMGAGLAARFVPLRNVKRVLPAGILIGVGVCLLPLAKSLTLAYALMAFVGVCSGFFIVPLDALLQQQGQNLVGTGSAVAIQNFFENFSMLALISAYTAATYLRISANAIALGLGLSLALSVSALTTTRRIGVGQR